MKFNFSEVTKAVQAMINDFLERLPYLAIALVVFLLFLSVGKGIRNLVLAIAERNRKHYSLGLVLGRLCSGVAFLVGLLVALVIAIPGFTPGQLISVLGLSSVAIGFAFRDILQNFLAGILLLISEPFRIGDQIVVNDFEGTVEDIQTRATFLRTYDGRRIVIPNANMFTTSVTVNTATERRRLQYEIGIGYTDNTAETKRLMLNAVSSVPGVLAEPAPDAFVIALTDKTVNVRLRWWIDAPRHLDVLKSQDMVLEKIKDALIAAGADVPFKPKPPVTTASANGVAVA